MARVDARTLSVASLALALAVAVAWRGGVGVPAQAAALVLAAASLALAAATRRATLRVPVALGGLAVLVVVPALQLVPLPPALTQPGARDVFEVALAPLGLYPAARPTTLDLPATARELGKAAAVLAAGGAAALLAASHRTRDALLGLVAAAGASCVAAGFGAALAGAGPVLEPRLVFVNPNHLAALLALASWPALGLSLAARGPIRAAWLAAFAISGLGIFLTLSRAGIAAFFAGWAVFAVLQARRAATEVPGGRSPWRAAVAPAAIGVVLAAAAVVALEPVLAELRSVARVAGDPRAEVWPAAVRMLARHPLLGIGRGAFAAAFAGHREDLAPVTYTHAENEWLQTVVDLGLPAGLAVLAALVWTFGAAARPRDLPRAVIGALAGLAALGVHVLFDFAPALPGVAVPLGIVLGAVASPLRGVRLPRPAWPIAALVLAAGGLGGLGYQLRHPAEEGDLVARAPSADQAVRLARAQAPLRPADWLPQAAAGIRLVQEGRCAEGLPWLGRAMWLAPTAPEPHRYAARCLAAGGRGEEARVEYRLATSLGDARALEEAIHRFPSVDELLAAAPDTPAGRSMLGTILARAGRPSDAALALEDAVRQYPDPALRADLARYRLEAGDAGGALESARAALAEDPRDVRARVLAARALERLGDAGGARAELELGLARNPGSPEIVLALAEALCRAGRHAQAVQTLRAGAWRNGAEAARARLLAVAALRAQGRLVEAVAEARVARDLDPRTPATHEALADALAASGLVEEALEVLVAAARLPATAPGALDGRIAALQAAARARAERRGAAAR
jgi:tetratricopeptide (TPR) repeat protein/O-antigen ligase